jgi:hypothetical protein
MKKVLFTIFFITLFNNVSFAQSKYSLGIIFGPNYTSFRGSDFVQETKPGYGFQAGISLEYSINKSFTLGTGLNLEQKIIHYNTDFTVDYISEFGMFEKDIINAETNNKYKYFSVPLFLKYCFGHNKSYFISGGVFISFLQNYKKESSFENKSGGDILYSSNSIYNFPLAEDVSGDYGVSFGFGKSFELNEKNKISIEIRDNLGLQNTVDRTSKYGVSGVIKTNCLNLMAGWAFDL